MENPTVGKLKAILLGQDRSHQVHFLGRNFIIHLWQKNNGPTTMTTIHSSLKKKTWRDLSLAFQWSLHSGYGGFLTAPTSHHYTPSVSTGDELKRKKQWQQCLLQLEVTLKIWWDMKHLLKNVLQTDVWVYMETISNHEISSIFSFQNSSLKRPHPHTHTRPPPNPHQKKKSATRMFAHFKSIHQEGQLWRHPAPRRPPTCHRTTATISSRSGPSAPRPWGFRGPGGCCLKVHPLQHI